MPIAIIQVPRFEVGSLALERAPCEGVAVEPDLCGVHGDEGGHGAQAALRAPDHVLRPRAVVVARAAVRTLQEKGRHLHRFGLLMRLSQ